MGPALHTVFDFGTDVPVNQMARPVSVALRIPLITFLGLCWLSTYVMVMRRGFKERWLGIPLAALGGNIAWEFAFSFVYSPEPAQRVFNFLWFFIDVVIFIQALLYGRKDFPALSRAAYGWSVAGLLAFTVPFMILAPYESGDEEGAYAAFALNAFMSFAFISMLRRRATTDGQTMYIALAKMLGTVTASMLFLNWYPTRWLLDLFHVTIFVLDSLYVVLLYRKFKAEGVSPWRKV